MPALRQKRPLAAANGHVALTLRDHVRQHAQNRPGVYRMIAEDDRVVYVGKSVRVRSRLLSYFRADRGAKATDIISASRRIAWEHVPSEFAALLLEQSAIHRWRPIFNVQHKLDRGLCFIKLTREAAPRLLMTAQVAPDGAVYYGPFRGPFMVRTLLRELRDLLELRDCAASTTLRFADQMDLFAFQATPACIRADLGKCLAPCAGRCTRAAYLARIEEAKQFLDGGVHRPLRVLKTRMLHAAERLQFEYAAELRDRGMRLRDARAELIALRDSFEALTFLYHVPGYAGDDRVYLIRRGHVEREWPVHAGAPLSDHILSESAALLGRAPAAHGAIDAAHAGRILLVARWFRLRPDELLRVRRLETPA